MISGMGWETIMGCRQMFYVRWNGEFRKELPLTVCRYIDWFITTPLMILNIGLLAGEEQWMIAAIMGADSESLAASLIVTLRSDVHVNDLTDVTCLTMKI